MFDLKLENKCNHRIINEPLKIKGEFPNYYAILNYPASGNNGKVIILNQENLFKNKYIYNSEEDKTLKINKDFKEVPFILGDNNQTIIFTNIEKDLDYVYPKQYFYATYWTSQNTCPRCKEQNGKINDISLNPIGKLNTIDGFASFNIFFASEIAFASLKGIKRFFNSFITISFINLTYCIFDKIIT